MRIYQLRLDEFFHCMHAFCFAADPLESPADPLESLGFLGSLGSFWFTLGGKEIVAAKLVRRGWDLLTW